MHYTYSTTKSVGPRADAHNTAVWKDWTHAVFFDGRGKRMASQTIDTETGTLVLAPKELQQASFLWSDSGYGDHMPLQEFVDKVLGK